MPWYGWLILAVIILNVLNIPLQRSMLVRSGRGVGHAYAALIGLAMVTTLLYCGYKIFFP